MDDVVTCWRCRAPMTVRDSVAIRGLVTLGPNLCLWFSCLRCGVSMLVPPERANKRALGERMADIASGVILTPDGVTNPRYGGK